MKSKRIFSLVFMVALLALPIAANCAIRYVKTTGLDTNNGSTWALAKKTIAAGLSIAVSGDEIWTMSGTYNERITLKSGVGLYGGFNGTETARTQRNVTANITTINGSAISTVVQVPASASATTTIDGFTITNGAGGFGGGMACVNAGAVISNNTITANKAQYYGGGIYAEDATLTIKNNIISSNSAPFGAGIACFNSGSPFILANRILSNTSKYDGSGIYCYHNSSANIAGNIVASNTASSEGAGFYVEDSSPTVVNNTLSGNAATAGGGGISILNASPTIVNNIIANGNSGISNAGSGLPILVTNCLYNNTSAAYTGLTAGASDFVGNPGFVDQRTNNFHLLTSSICINAGANDAPGLPSTDIDSEARLLAGAVDVGADEVAGLAPALGTLDLARTAKNNTWVLLPDQVVSGAFPDVFYMQSADPRAGISVYLKGHTILQNQLASVEGVIKTNSDGERFIYALSASASGSGTVKPIFMKDLYVGGSDLLATDGSIAQKGISNNIGPNNIGLLLTVYGAYTYIDAHTCIVDDGSGATVKCITPSNVVLNPSSGWSNVLVTGVSSTYIQDGNQQRLIRIRTLSDIKAY